MVSFNYQTHTSVLFLQYFAIYLVLVVLIGHALTLVIKQVNYKPIAHVIATLMAVIMLWTRVDIFIFFEINPKLLLTLFYPPIVFKIIYELDLGMFRKRLTFIILYAVIMSSAYSILLGLCMVHLNRSRWTMMMIPIIGYSLGSIDYMETTVISLSLTDFRSVILVLIQVESVMGSELCYTLMQLFLGIYDGSVSRWFQVVSYLVRKYLGGVLYGLVVSRLLHATIECFMDRLEVAALFIILTPTSVYFFGEHLLNVSGGVAVIFFAHAFTMYKTHIPARVGRDLDKINACISRISLTILIFFSSVPLTVRTIQYFDTAMAMEYLSLYIMMLCARCVLLMVTVPIMRCFDVRQNILGVCILILLAKRGPVQSVYFLEVLHDDAATAMAQFCTPYAYFLITTSLFVNPEMFSLVSNLLNFTKSEMNSRNIVMCVKGLEDNQRGFISILRMSPAYMDVHWKFVMHALKRTWSIADALQLPSREYLQRQSYCRNCRKVVKFEPSAKELKTLLIDAKKTVMKAHKMSFITQFERGRFQKHVNTILMNFMDCSLDSNDLSLDPMLFRHFIYKETTIFKLRAFIRNVDIGPVLLRPRKPLRYFFFRIVVNVLYAIFLFCVVAFSIAVQIWDLVTQGDNDTALVLKFVVFLIFFWDFVMKILAYSHIVYIQGFRRYFTNGWDLFDFILLIVYAVDIVVVYLMRKMEHNLAWDLSFVSIKSIVWIQLFRCIKVMFVLKRYERIILKFLDRLIGLRIMLAVDIGEAMIRSYDEVLHALPKLVKNESIREELARKARADRLVIKSELINRTAERDWVMVTFATRLVIRNCFFALKNKVNEMWMQGYIDDFEHKKLKQAQESCLRDFLALKVIKKPDDEELIFNLGFLYDDKIRYYCYVNSQKIQYRKGQVIMNIGDTTDGLLIMTSGLVSVVFEPADYDVYLKYGALPGVDDLDEEELFTRRTYYMMCGSMLGEMSMLTERPYQCRIIAKETSEFLVISTKVLDDASERSSTKDAGVWSLLWSHWTLKLVNSLLWKAKPFHSGTKDEVMLRTMKGFFVDFTDCAGFARSKYIEEIIVIEGTLRDNITGDIYVAPCYLPRHVQFITFHRKDSFMVDPQLYIIPLDVDLIEAIFMDLSRTMKPRTDVEKKWTHGYGARSKRVGEVLPSTRTVHLSMEGSMLLQRSTSHGHFGDGLESSSNSDELHSDSGGPLLIDLQQRITEFSWDRIRGPDIEKVVEERATLPLFENLSSRRISEDSEASKVVNRDISSSASTLKRRHLENSTETFTTKK